MSMLLLALSPAIVEELLFRGFALGSLRRGQVAGPKAVVWAAVYFAAMHLSVHRFLLTFVLGCLLGFVALRARSVFASMFLHLVYNGSLIWGVDWFSRHQPPIDPQGPVAWVLSLLALAGGVWLLTRGARPLRGERRAVL
jgi:membrane protease YdiL (CAAX protease family)